MNDAALTTEQKALALKQDLKPYGTFAEIGGGQEVARRFFHVGGAAGTVAKTISAYDVAVSDAVYGPTHQYVSRQRLEAMLDHEYAQLLERWGAKRGETTTYSAFPRATLKQLTRVCDDNAMPWAETARCERPSIAS